MTNLSNVDAVWGRITRILPKTAQEVAPAVPDFTSMAGQFAKGFMPWKGFGEAPKPAPVAPPPIATPAAAAPVPNEPPLPKAGPPALLPPDDEPATVTAPPAPVAPKSDNLNAGLAAKQKALETKSKQTVSPASPTTSTAQATPTAATPAAPSGFSNYLSQVQAVGVGQADLNGADPTQAGTPTEQELAQAAQTFNFKPAYESQQEYASAFRKAMALSQNPQLGDTPFIPAGEDKLTPKQYLSQLVDKITDNPELQKGWNKVAFKDEAERAAVSPEIQKIIAEKAVATSQILGDAKTSGLAIDDLVGDMSNRWGNVAVLAGLALMFFGGSTGMLAGGLLAAAGGANIYGRVQNLGKPSTSDDLAAMQALKSQKIIPWTQQAYDTLAKSGIPSERLATLRDVHALVGLGGLNTANRQVLEKAQRSAWVMSGGDPAAVKSVTDRLLSEFKSKLPALPEGAEADTVGAEYGWMDKAVDTVTGRDGRKSWAPTSSAPIDNAQVLKDTAGRAVSDPAGTASRAFSGLKNWIGGK